MGGSWSKSKTESKRGEEDTFLKQREETVDTPFCQKISKDEYDSQRLMGAGGTNDSIRQLFDAIVNGQNLSLDFQLDKLKQFQVEYPFIFKEKHGEEAIQQIKNALKEKKAKEGNSVFNILMRK